MKVLFDYQVFCWQQYGGISRYIYEIATRLARIDNLDVKILAFAHLNSYLKQCPSGLVTGLYIPAIPKTFNLRIQFNLWLSKLYLSVNPPDIVHQTYYSRFKTVNDRSRVVLTVHDMIHEKFQHFFPGKEDISETKIKAIKRADRVICVSSSTKNDLVGILEIDPHKITVIPHGFSVLPQSSNSNIQSYSNRPYILYVGQRQKHKNFLTLLQAYASSEQLKKTVNLVCFGGNPISSEEYDMIHQLGIPGSQIIYLTGDDQKLSELYRHASAFVFPSLYEGFGMPVLEAMALDCPVVCSNTSSLPEVAGNAAEFFDPYSKESIANALERVLFLSGRRTTLIQLGKQQIKKFSWDKCAERTYAVYSELA